MTSPISALFLHDTVSHQLLIEGNVRERLAMQSPPARPIELSDYNYCKHILRDGHNVPHQHMSLLDGETAGPAVFRRLFRGRDPEAKLALLEALEFDVIALSSGHRASAIADERELEQLKIAYKWLFATLAAQPLQFVVLTPPPLPPMRTEKVQAGRARELADWLIGESAKWESNIAVLDLFNLLSERDGPQANRLRKPYRTRSVPSRLNSRGADVAGLALATALIAAAERRPYPEPGAGDIVTELVTRTPRRVS